MGNVYKGAGQMPLMEKCRVPTLQHPTDIVIRVHKTTICGTDLHIMEGGVPTALNGVILGHEGIGHVVEAGNAVTTHKVGDRVVVSCITGCGKCPMCAQKRFAACSDGGWQLGHTIDGMQAEYARIPHADTSAFPLPVSRAVPAGSSKEDAFVMVSDALPTSYEIGLRGGALPPNGSIAVVGVGPVGLAALMCAREQCASSGKIIAIDTDVGRLQCASEMGADVCVLNPISAPSHITSTTTDAVTQIMEQTNGKGVDYVVECTGKPGGWDVCQNIVATGGEISILGVHGSPATLNLDELWSKNISIHTGMVHGDSVGNFVDLIHEGRLDPTPLISHHHPLSDLDKAYQQFKAGGTALKMLVTNDFVVDQKHGFVAEHVQNVMSFE